MKEFDSLSFGADPINLFCSLCNSTLASFPQYGNNGSQTNSDQSSFDRIEKTKDVEEHAADTQKTDTSKNFDGQDEKSSEILDEEKDSELEALPTHGEIYQQEEMPGCTGFQDPKDLGVYFVAAKLVGDECNLSLVIGNLNSMILTQSRDPNCFAVTERQSFWKFSEDPYTRATALIMYGYDLYDAWRFGDCAFVSYCMIMGSNCLPLGYILFKMGRTRCAAPRVDGFLYDVREDK